MQPDRYSLDAWKRMSPKRRFKKSAEWARKLLRTYQAHESIEEKDWLRFTEFISIIGEETPPSIHSPSWLRNMIYKWAQKAEWRISDNMSSLLSGDLLNPVWDWGEWVVYIDSLRSLHNIGSIIRTVEAFRLGEVWLHPSIPLSHPSLSKTSMGALDLVTIRHVTEEELFLKAPQPIVALEITDDAISLYDWVPSDHGTIIVGNEELGCSPKLLTNVSYVVYIPLGGCKGSINVANSFAIAASKITEHIR